MQNVLKIMLQCELQKHVQKDIFGAQIPNHNYSNCLGVGKADKMYIHIIR